MDTSKLTDAQRQIRRNIRNSAALVLLART